MKRRNKFLIFMCLSLAIVVLAWGSDQGLVRAANDTSKKYHGRVTPAERQEAAERAKEAGFELPVMGEKPMAAPYAAPHYFSHPNYANSPLKWGDAVIEFVNDPSDTTGAGAAAAASFDPATGAITAITVTDPGADYTAPPSVVITSPVAGGTGAAATAALDALGGVASVTVTNGGSGYVTGTGIQKFVNGLPGLGPAGANNLGQYIPVAVPDTTTYPGSDYYEIGLVQYREKMHRDLPPTLLRGYVQLSTSVVPGAHVPLSNANLNGGTTPTGYFGVDNPHYLGPAIVATKNRPVRILFRNLLPTGSGGDLFIPVDTTVMGSGMGPMMGGMAEMDPQNPMCGDSPKPNGCFKENRATLHLHGGISPWISDGTPHQWTTPANENTPYPKGVSVQNVPDMPNPGPGALTFFYTNQQSARLMFYHDHAWGITRLNVYVGEAAPYIITDDTEQSLITQGLIPGAADTIWSSRTRPSYPM
jgi:hypothetical protein